MRTTSAAGARYVFFSAFSDSARFSSAESAETFCFMILPDLNFTVARAGITKLLPG